MSFDIFTVTTEGTTILAEATASNKIILDSIALSSNYPLTISALRAWTPTNFSFNGSIYSSTSTGTNTARIEGLVRQSDLTAAKTVRACAIIAHTENNPTQKTLCAQAFTSSSKFISLRPSSEGGDAKYYFPFNIAFINSSEDVLDVTAGQSASIEDLDRFVSRHKAGDTTAGDSQTILGDKTFSNQTTFNGASNFNGISNFYGNAVIQTADATEMSVDAIFTLPNGTRWRIGTQGAPFNEIYSDYFYGVIPTPDIQNGLTVPVGAFCMTIGYTGNIGDTLQIGSSDAHPCDIQGAVDSTRYLPEGRYKFISPAYNVSSPILLIRLV